ncbi:MAG: thioesterase [Sphingobacteriales bacterium 41-5]|nr:MAG: thioesterase [Niabella sp. SCN 42-15]OJU29526.1 MAG: thioesterase [Sphingobacteriales bacterium 41-5]
MPRVKIQLPEKFSFVTEIPVRITDVNYGGHVGNDSILGILHEARLRFLKHHGYSEMDLGGSGMIMADVAIEFKHEAFYGDTVIASVAANDFQRVSFDIYYKLEKESNGEKLTVAIAKTGLVCYNYSSKKNCNLPVEVVNQLSS